MKQASLKKAGYYIFLICILSSCNSSQNTQLESTDIITASVTMQPPEVNPTSSPTEELVPKASEDCNSERLILFGREDSEEEKDQLYVFCLQSNQLNQLPYELLSRDEGILSSLSVSPAGDVLALSMGLYGTPFHGRIYIIDLATMEEDIIALNESGAASLT